MSEVTSGERGPAGDHGQTGDQGQAGREGLRGERGQTGSAGSIGERGPIGLIGTVGAVGERGPVGDHGQHGDTGDSGQQGVQGQRGMSGKTGLEGRQGDPGEPGITIAKRSVWTNVWTAFGLAAIAASVLLVVLFAYNRVDAIEEELKDRNAEHAQLSIEANELDNRIREERAIEQDLEDCVTLYSDDIRNGLALSQIALSDLFSAVVVRPAPLTDEEREAGRVINVGLVEAVDQANNPLRLAVEALSDYRALDPSPDKCPHPRA